MNSPSARCASPLLSPFPMTDKEAGEDASGLLELGACLLCYRKCVPHDNLSPCCSFIITLQQVGKPFVSQPFIICIVTSSLLCGNMTKDSHPIQLTALIKHRKHHIALFKCRDRHLRTVRYNFWDCQNNTSLLLHHEVKHRFTQCSISTLCTGVLLSILGVGRLK
jgi:hypothetical protein